jgi:cytochrome c oxidase subunit 2
MFSGISNFANEVDKTFVFIIGISFFFLIGITITMIVFAVKYNRKRHPKPVQIKDNTAIEITWIIVPLVLVLFMFYYGYSAFLIERRIPKNAIPLKVISKMWNWTFDYGNGKFSKDTLVVPVNKAIRLDMVSMDVNHSFYIPAFRIKEDVVPGTTTHMWFIAEKIGTYEILCAEFCGLRHSYMEGRVKVVDSITYNNWLAGIKIIDPNAEPPGLKILKQNACIACHSIDGSKLVGPSFKGFYGKDEIVITDGKERHIVSDSTYIKESILNPDKDIVKGYSKGLMKSYKDLVKDSDIRAITEYFKTIK